MKKILLFIVCLGGLLSTQNLQAQSFSTEADTVWLSVSTTITAVDYITNLTGATVNINWHVTASNFPSDWTDSAALGICDDQFCRQNGGGQLWNGSTGSTFSAPYYANAGHDSIGDFHLQLLLPSTATAGTYYMTVNAREIGGGTNKNMMFIFNKVAESVTNVNNQEANITLYPNPAHNEVNLIYSSTADIKNIAVYNIIGKIIAVYKATENNSANLNLENLPSGIYFARLINSQGNVVVTRKFTKQ